MPNEDAPKKEFGYADVEWRLREVGLTEAPDLMAELESLSGKLPTGDVPIEEAVLEYTEFSKQAIAAIALKFGILEKRILDIEGRG